MSEARAEHMTLGQTLRAARAAAGLSQTAVGAAVGISPTYLSKIEHDVGTVPSVALVRALAGLLAGDAEAWLQAAHKVGPAELRAALVLAPELGTLVRRVAAGTVSRAQVAAWVAASAPPAPAPARRREAVAFYGEED